MRCLHCGTDSPGYTTCPRCGATLAQLLPPFDQAERRFRALHERHRIGQVDARQYQSELRQLSVADAQGTYWSLAPDGRWLRYDPEGWVPADPPHRPLPPPAEPSPRPAPRPRRRRLGLAVGCAALVVVAAGLLVFTLVSGRQEYASTPLLVEGAPAQVAAPAPVPLSPAQQQDVIARLGPPESFTILFYQEPDGGSVRDSRVETWSYFTAGTEFSFLDGELVQEVPLDIPVSELVPLPYRPELFSAYMSLDEIIAAAGLGRHLVIPVEKELAEDARVYFADQLTFGLQGDELVFVETLPLDVE
jgi:hypothetical protein